VIDDLAEIVAARNLVSDLSENLPDLVFDGVRPAGLLRESVQVGKKLLVDEVPEIVTGHDGTKIRANASRHKAMSYGRMAERATELEAEVAGWLSAAEAADAEALRPRQDRRGVAGLGRRQAAACGEDPAGQGRIGGGRKKAKDAFFHQKDALSAFPGRTPFRGGGSKELCEMPTLPLRNCGLTRNGNVCAGRPQ
jgi:hypothetical protein